MVQLSVKADIREVERMLSDAERSVIPQAAATALNKSINRVRTLSIRELSKSLKIPQKILRKRLVVPHGLKASRRRLSASMIGLFLDINLSDVGKGRRTGKGVSVKGVTYPGSFRAVMPTGHEGIFKRVGKARLPIRHVGFPINPPADRIIGSNIGEVGPYWRKTFEHEVEFRLKRLRTR